MRELDVGIVEEAVRGLVISANIEGSPELMYIYKKFMELERSPSSRAVYEDYIKNLKIAKDLSIPICQDTGLAVVFLEVGQDVHFVGGYLYDAVVRGVERGYKEGYLRNSTVDPITREPTPGYNTPPIIHTDIVPGDRVKIALMPKGFGSENMSEARLFPPSIGREGIVDYVVGVVEKAGANPCPPVVVGVGIGGNLEKSAILSKKALLRPVGSRNPRDDVALLEEEIERRINLLGIGAQGFGGTVTTFGVHVEVFPTHIASIPVAVTIQCHVVRHREVVL